MKIEHILPDDVQAEIDRIDKQLIEIEKGYLEDYLKRPFWNEVCTLEMDYRNDWRVRALEKMKAHIYERETYKTILITENEEEKEMLKERFMGSESF